MVTTNTTEDSSNYVQPLTAAGPTKFTSSATAASGEVAESLALSEARSKAIETYGVGTTEFVSFNDVSTKITGSSPPFTYTTTATVSAIQLEEVRAQSPLPVGESTTNINPSSDAAINSDGAAEGGNTAANDAALANAGTQDMGDSAAEGGNTVGIIANRTINQLPPKIDPPKDWRVRISLAPGSKYFYNVVDSQNRNAAGILEPLRGTGGVVFPYTPTISVSYNAKYDTQALTHTNYNIHTYSGSSVDNVSVTADFTAQDVNEANYMLAVIHFFRSATKMFYGGDQTPIRGTPPPLLYLSGYGQYQFDNHPMVLTNFNYSTPVDVDYINAYPVGTDKTINGVSLTPYLKPNTAKPSFLQRGLDRLLGSGLNPGGTSKPSVFVNAPTGNNLVTRVPTKISIALTFLPIVTRKAMTGGIDRNGSTAYGFSLKDYANGSLLRGSQHPKNGGGLW